MQHLSATREECKAKGITGKEVFKIAAKTYKKSDPSSSKVSCEPKKTRKKHSKRHSKKRHSRKKSRGGKRKEKKPKKGHIGAKSITRPDHIDWRTHKGSKFYRRNHHLYNYNAEGVVGKPYQHHKKQTH